jgi:hypothetical protein
MARGDQSDVEAPARGPSFGPAGVLLGIGLGGFIDGILLHQILQWHHMISHDEPVDTVLGLERNTLWDGLFHAFTWAAVLVGLALFARQVDRAATHCDQAPRGLDSLWVGALQRCRRVDKPPPSPGSPRQGRRGRTALMGSRVSRLRRRTPDRWLAASAVRPERFHQALILPSGWGTSACYRRLTSSVILTDVRARRPGRFRSGAPRFVG